MVVSRNETQLNIDAAGTADQSDAVQQFEVVVGDVPNDVIQTNDVAGNQNDVVQDVEAASPASQNDVVQQSDSATTNLVEGQNAELIKSSDDESLEDDDDEDVDQNRGRKRKYQHHTKYQTTELESFFEECPHLNEKQMIHLSRKLVLEMKQIKFWFKNCRTEMKTQLEHHENTMLIRAKEKLQAENHFLREILADKTCVVCGNHVGPKSLAIEYEELRAEKARLKKEICALTDKLLNKTFIRSYEKEIDSVWSVVDICVDANEGSSSNSDPASLRLPPGCIINDLNNGCSKVTWVEHVQYDESLVHPMIVNHGWEEELNEAVPKNGERLLPEKLSPGTVGENVRIMSRKNSTDPDEAMGIVLSTSTSLWLPVSRRRVFEFWMREDIRKD
ncbi:Homeobox-leucine zipper protein HDG7 [Linum perenne]